MWLRFAVLGDLFCLEVSTTTETTGITGGSGGDFERAVEVEEVYYPEERFGFS